MHFPIIAIESPDTKKRDFKKYLPYEDACFSEHTDYYGDLYDEGERKEVINSNWFKDLLDGFAILDTKNETITFLDAETTEKNLSDYLIKTTGALHERAKNGELLGHELRWAGEEYKGYSTLFYHDFGKTSFDFIDDSIYYAGQTFKIGNIFDAHY